MLLNRLLHADINSDLVELLMKQDQMSMAASLESRLPFLDQELVEFAMTIPGQYSVKGAAEVFAGSRQLSLGPASAPLRDFLFAGPRAVVRGRSTLENEILHLIYIRSLISPLICHAPADTSASTCRVPAESPSAAFAPPY
jgi:hypothetical protein